MKTQVQYTCVVASMGSEAEAREPHLTGPLSSMWSNSNHLEHHLPPHLLHNVVNQVNTLTSTSGCHLFLLQGVPITEGPFRPTTTAFTTTTTTTTTTIATTTTTTTRCVTTTTSSYSTNIGWTNEASGLRELDRSSIGEEEEAALSWQRRLNPSRGTDPDPGVSWDLVITVTASSVSTIFLLFTIAVIVRQRLRKRKRSQVHPDIQLTPSSSSLTSSPPGAESVASFQQRFSHFQPELLHHRPETAESEEGGRRGIEGEGGRRTQGGGGGVHFEGPVGRGGGVRTDEVVGGTSREASEGGEGGGGGGTAPVGGVGGGCLCGVSVHYSISYTAPIPSPVPSSAATPVGLLQISREPGDSQKSGSEGPGGVGLNREGYRELVRGHRSGRNSLVCDV